MTQIDPFDFTKYKSFRNLLVPYYSGCELFIRSAVFIEYMLSIENNPWSVKNRQELSIEEQYAPLFEACPYEVKHFISLVTDKFDKELILSKLYNHLNIPREDIKELLHKYHGYHCELFNRVYKKYIDPNHITKIWFTDSQSMYNFEYILKNENN